MIVPLGFESFADALRCVAEVYQNLKKLLSEKKWEAASETRAASRRTWMIMGRRSR